LNTNYVGVWGALNAQFALEFLEELCSDQLTLRYQYFIGAIGF
jgi:hypothetical protein